MNLYQIKNDIERGKILKMFECLNVANTLKVVKVIYDE